MTHFLDRPHFEWDAPGAVELRDLLASVYYRTAQIEQLALQAGISPAYFTLEGPAVSVWFELIRVASNQGKLRALLQSISAGPDRAIAERLDELLDERPVVEAPEELPQPGAFAAFKDPDEQERQIFRANTLQDVVFLRRGTELASSVCRLRVTAHDGARYHGTAFCIGEDLLLTNHHVLYDGQGRGPEAVEAWFGYEADLNGRTREHVVVPCAPETVAGDAALDWAVIRAAAVLPDEALRVPLPDSTSVGLDDRVYIIQHPHGEVKKLAARHNVVRHVDDVVIQYWTDTERGSSGSPVFDEHWQLVAVHRRWRRIGELGTEAEFRNEGLRIERVVEDLARRQLV
ncbi:trypsin-like peptidase domain-containing protein [Streptomyces sp. NPDC096142]|uniref:trypsin-like peptidase domain-containing protein n=1 Tax=Streptomyces sp. NPDC096142 TaxID=3366077 RepID=UPI003824C673